MVTKKITRSVTRQEINFEEEFTINVTLNKKTLKLRLCNEKYVSFKRTNGIQNQINKIRDSVQDRQS